MELVYVVAMVISAILIAGCKCAIEPFTAPGVTLTQPPNWFLPGKYNSSQWLTPMFPNQISQPECLSYNRGDPNVLNYNSSAYIFWRL